MAMTPEQHAAYCRGLKRPPGKFKLSLEPPAGSGAPELPGSCWTLDKWYDPKRSVRSSGPGVAAPGTTPLQRR